MIYLTTTFLVTTTLIFSNAYVREPSISLSPTTQSTAAGGERAKIEFLAGRFATTIDFPPIPSMPKGATGKGTSDITWVLDSTFLSIEDQSLNSLFGNYKAHGMLGFDPQIRQYVLSMFNNFGDHPTYHGDFAGDTLVLQTKVAAPRGSFDQKLLWYKDGEAVKMKILNDMGKGPVLVLEQTATPVSHKMK